MMPRTPLYLGLTRPAIIAGVTLPYWVLNVTINLILFLATSSWMPVFWLAPLSHLLAVLATRFEHHWVSICACWLRFMLVKEQRGEHSYEPC